MSKNSAIRKPKAFWDRVGTSKNLSMIGCILTIVFVLFTNYFTHFLYELFKNLKFIFDTSAKGSKAFKQVDLALVPNANNLFNFKIAFVAPLVYFPILLVLMAIVLRYGWILWQRHRNYNENLQGKAEWEDPKVAEGQYKKIPDRDKTYPGIGGIPIMHKTTLTPRGKLLNFQISHPKITNGLVNRLINHFETAEQSKESKAIPGSYYIDTTTINTIVNGTTRSGKGQTIVNPMIDILSRAQDKSSMAINDPKGELLKQTSRFLQKRGYEVRAFNLQNTEYSLSYNPLTKIIEYTKLGNFTKSAEAIREFAESIYKNDGQGNGNEAFWTNSSVAIFSALVLGTLVEAKRTGDWSKVTMSNVVDLMTDLGGTQEIVDGNNNRIEARPGARLVSKLTLYFDSLRKINQETIGTTGESDQLIDAAISAFQQSKFAGEETSGNIFSSAMAQLQIYTQENIRRLTSLNDFRLSRMGFPRLFEMQLPIAYGDSIVDIEFINPSGKTIFKTRTICDHIGSIQLPVKQFMPDDFEVKVRFGNESNPTTIQDSKVKLSGQKVYKRRGLGQKGDFDHMKMAIISSNVESDDQSFEETEVEHIVKCQYEYTEKPIALFFVTPPNREPYMPLVSFLIDQIFQANFDLAGQVDGKLHDRVYNIFDEFGNMAKIPSMGTKLSLAAGLGYLFVIIVQSYSQVFNLYGDTEGKTILSNLGNQIYIKSSDQATLEEISKALGSRTAIQRTSNKQAYIGSRDAGQLSTQAVSENLMDVDQLALLKPGEMIIIRTMTRQDNKGRAINGKPLYNMGRYAMPSSYMLLGDEFDPKAQLSDVGQVSRHAHLNLNDKSMRWQKAYELLYLQTHEDFTNQKTQSNQDISENEASNTAGSNAGSSASDNEKAVNNSKKFAFDVERINADPNYLNQLVALLLERLKIRLSDFDPIQDVEYIQAAKEAQQILSTEAIDKAEYLTKIKTGNLVRWVDLLSMEGYEQIRDELNETAPVDQIKH